MVCSILFVQFDLDLFTKKSKTVSDSLFVMKTLGGVQSFKSINTEVSKYTQKAYFTIVPMTTFKRAPCLVHATCHLDMIIYVAYK